MKSTGDIVEPRKLHEGLVQPTATEFRFEKEFGHINLRDKGEPNQEQRHAHRGPAHFGAEPRHRLEAEVVGNGTVIVIDGFSLSSSNVEEFVNNETISIRDLRVHILGRGEKYSIPQINPPHK